MPLFEKQIRNAKPREKAYKLYDARGLFLMVHPNGSRYWRLRYDYAGRERVFQLGTYPEVTLAAARDQAQAARQQVKVGQDPVTERRLSRVKNVAETLDSFEVVAAEWMDRNRARWSPTYLAKIETAMRTIAFPRLGSLPIARLDAKMVRTVVEPVEARGALEAARKLRKWLSEVFSHAIGTGRITLNPCDHVKVATRPTKGHPHLTRAELGEFLRALNEYPGRPETRLAVLLLLRTFVRTGELRAAQWSEFDLAAREWRIPGARMKGGAEQIVPLSTQAIALLEELRTLTGHVKHLFPGGRHRVPYISENTINKAIAAVGFKGRVVGHGFRATASTILNESGLFHADAIERQLAHAPRDKIRAAYHRAEYLPERRKMMQWWSDLLDATTHGASITQLKHTARGLPTDSPH